MHRVPVQGLSCGSFRVSHIRAKEGFLFATIPETHSQGLLWLSIPSFYRQLWTFRTTVVPGPYDARLLDELLGTLKGIGVRRVYWLYYGDVDLESLWAGSLYENAQIPYGTQTLEAIGEPLKAAVPVAHRHGLEIYGVLKPYNTGMSGTNGPQCGRRLSGIEQIGGAVPQVIPFLERLPSYAVEEEA